jgi:hypothetical protein
MTLNATDNVIPEATQWLSGIHFQNWVPDKAFGISGMTGAINELL